MEWGLVGGSHIRSTCLVHVSRPVPDQDAHNGVYGKGRVRNYKDSVPRPDRVDRETNGDDELADKEPLRHAFACAFLPLFVDLFDERREQQTRARPADDL